MPRIVFFAILLVILFLGAMLFLTPGIPEVPEVLSPQSKGSGDQATFDLVSREIDRSEKEIFKRFRELSLTDKFYQDRRAYRLILLPTFDAPLLVEAQSYDESYFLKVKKLSGHGGYGIAELGELAGSEERSLDREEWNRLMHLVEQSGFWRSPRIIGEDPMPDGATWLMYGAARGSYGKICRGFTAERLVGPFQTFHIWLKSCCGFTATFGGSGPGQTHRPGQRSFDPGRGGIGASVKTLSELSGLNASTISRRNDAARLKTERKRSDAKAAPTSYRWLPTKHQMIRSSRLRTASAQLPEPSRMPRRRPSFPKAR
jgi:hypothetical protein